MFEPIKRAVGVVVLEERNQRCRNRNELLRRNVHVLDVFAQRQDEFTGLSSRVAFVDDVAHLHRARCWPDRRRACLLPTRSDRTATAQTRPFCRQLATFLFAFSTSSCGTCSPGLNFVSPPLMMRTYSTTRPSLTFRYGASIKPNSLIRAKHDRLEISPMFGPSGVSIGQMRP